MKRLICAGYSWRNLFKSPPPNCFCSSQINCSLSNCLIVALRIISSIFWQFKPRYKNWFKTSLIDFSTQLLETHPNLPPCFLQTTMLSCVFGMAYNAVNVSHLFRPPKANSLMYIASAPGSSSHNKTICTVTSLSNKVV